MSDFLFFFITTVYILWVAISGAKSKQKRDINAAKPGQPGLTGIDKIALAENASFSFDAVQDAQQPGQHHSYDHDYRDAPVSSEANQHSTDSKDVALTYERKQKQVV